MTNPCDNDGVRDLMALQLLGLSPAEREVAFVELVRAYMADCQAASSASSRDAIHLRALVLCVAVRHRLDEIELMGQGVTGRA